jgi:glycosyltransferase involved in cell wall biosynthesis
MKNKISIIIPCKDEKLSLDKVLTELKKIKLINEIIVVVDNKKDKSIKVIKKNNCRYIVQKNKGYGSAIIEGFKKAKNNYGCIFNADHSFIPKYLPKMQTLSQKNDFIFGTRYKGNSGSEDDNLLTYTGNKIFSFICRNFLNIKLTDVLYTYVLCNTKKFNLLKFKNHDFRFCIELPYNVSKKSFKYTEIPMFERKRFAGKKKVNEFKDGFLISLEIIRCFFSK